MGCSICQDSQRRKQNKFDNQNENAPNEQEYAPKEVLQEIINSLSKRKEYLEQKLQIPQYPNNDNNNIEMKYPEEYLKYINQLILEINELEQRNSRKILNNSKIIINFYTMTGQTSIVIVDKETKLRDAFIMAFSNERYTINEDRETQFSDAYSKTANSKDRFNFDKIVFSFGGDIISEKFRKNELVSSLGNDTNSPISILVKFPIKTQILSNTKNYYYNQ
jgi:hypothetical protein